MELSEAGAGDEVIMSIAGQVSRAMLSRYSHVQMGARRRALDEIAARQRAAEWRSSRYAVGDSSTSGHGAQIRRRLVTDLAGWNADAGRLDLEVEKAIEALCRYGEAREKPPLFYKVHGLQTTLDHAEALEEASRCLGEGTEVFCVIIWVLERG